MTKLYLKTLGVLCLSLFTFNISAQTTYYVKTGGTGAAATATSWATASPDLQDVINTAQAGDRIFVKGGTYLPNRPANTPTLINAANRDNAFVLKDGLSIYGGFAGTEDNETQRVAGNETILSGDLNGDDAIETSANASNYMAQNKTDNVHHVVIAVGLTTNTVFDGFALAKGDASGSSTLSVNSKNVDRRFGAGMYILDSGTGFIISNVRASIHRAVGDNSAAAGAGFYINNSSPTIDKCEISKCYNTNATPKTAGYIYGAAMSLVASSNATIKNTVFSENFGSYGGAVSSNSSNATFTNCTFKLNRSHNGRGGAIDIRGGLPIFTNCLFAENSVGGADGGGAVYNFSGRPTFQNCIFYKNSTGSNGGVYGTQNGSNYGAIFINNTFYDNKNTRAGSAANYTAGLQVLAVGNSAAFTDKKTYLHNNIFFKNTFTATTTDTNTPDIYVASPTTLLGSVNYNIIQQTSQVSADPTNLIDTDPLFISVTPGDLAFLAPKTSSPAKDAGNNSYNTVAVDFNGRARKIGAIDIGAVEYYSVLPVSFISFTARATTVGAQLDWKVASETNNKQYIISRSTDGKRYDLVTKVAGANNSTAPLSYAHTDRTVVGGTYYYKLEQEDLDGKVNYLATQVVKIGFSAGGIKAYPNPTSNKVTLSINAGVFSKYSVIGLQGSTLHNGNINSTDEQIDLNLSNLAAGTYIIKLTGLTGNTSARVIKL